MDRYILPEKTKEILRKYRDGKKDSYKERQRKKERKRAFTAK